MSKLQKRARRILDTKGTFQVNDAFYNSVTGVGTSKYDVVHFCPEFFVTEQELSDLTDNYWLARRIVRALPEAAHQDEILWDSEADKARWREINAMEGNDDGAFLTADVWAQTHGCSLLILGQDFSGDPESPLQEGAPIDWLEPVASYDFHIGADDLETDRTNVRRYNKPKYYRIQGFHRLNGLRIHHSRVVHFSGPVLSDPEHSRDWRKMQQLSALDPVYSVLSGYGLSWSAFETMIQQGAVPIWKLKGLIMGTKQNAAEVLARMKLQQDQVSVSRAILLDADGNEDYERKMVSLAEIPEVMKQLAIQVSAAAGIPASEIFGKLITGLGDTESEDAERWDRRVGGYRTNTIAPRLRKIMGQDVKFDFKPLRKPNPQEYVTNVKAWWDMGQTLDSEIRQLTETALELPPLDAKGKAELEARNNAASTRSPFPFENTKGASPFSEENADPTSSEGSSDPAS